MLNELAKEVHAIAKEKGWHDKAVSFGDCISNLHCELSEAFEEYRNKKSLTEIYYAKSDKPWGIPIEFADVLIRLLDACEMYEINIDEAVKVKMDYNKTRPYRHGGKIV